MGNPFQKLLGTSPNYAKLRVYGCLCFPWLRPYTTHKLVNRSTPCVFLGYSLTQSAYICLQPSSGRIYISRHVKFDEKAFPFRCRSDKPPETEPPSIPLTSAPPVAVVLMPSSLALLPPPQVLPPLMSPPSSVRHQTVPPEINVTTDTSNSEAITTSQNQIRNPPITTETQPDNPLVSINPNTTGPSTSNQAHNNHEPSIRPNQTNPIPQSENNNPPLLLQPPPAENPVPENQHPMTTRRKNNITKPKSKLNLSVALSTPIPPEPLTVNQAMIDQKWRGAILNEIDAFAQNRTFDLVPRLPQFNVVGCKWLFKNKFLPNGSLRR